MSGFIAPASNADVYTSAYFALQNTCWGSAPSPFDPHFPMQAAPPCGMLLRILVQKNVPKPGRKIQLAALHFFFCGIVPCYKNTAHAVQR